MWFWGKGRDTVTGARQEEDVNGTKDKDLMRRSRQWRWSCGGEGGKAEREQGTGTVVMEQTGGR